MITTNNHHTDNSTVVTDDAPSAKNHEKLTTSLNFQVHQEPELEDGKLLRLFIDYVKQTGDFDYRSFEVEEDLSLSPEQEQRLVRLYIDYVKRTGDWDYPLLLQVIESESTSIQDIQEATSSPEKPQKVADHPQELSSEALQPIPSLNTREIKEVQHYFKEVQPEFLPLCLSLKTLLNQWVECLRPTYASQTEMRLRVLMEQIPEKEDYSDLINDFKRKQQQLSKFLNRLLSLAYKHKSALTTLPVAVSRRSLHKVIDDLAYIGLYIEENAQVTKIQQEIFLAHDPSIYLWRLNQYLDILPDLMAHLSHALEDLMTRQRLTQGEEEAG